MYSSSKKSSTTVTVDISPVSFQCLPAEQCPAVVVLKNEMPSVKFEKLPEGTTIAKCPVSDYAQAQEKVKTTCFGCRARGIR
ncbi:MAG: hypothetical protein IKP24_01660 [Alphaproteobacteria bacterium]|nr:hypothetical protein [Alphaproteobacteria bacterium]